MRDRYEPAMVTCLFHKHEKIALEIRLTGDVLLYVGWVSMRCLRWRRHSDVLGIDVSSMYATIFLLSVAWS